MNLTPDFLLLGFVWWMVFVLSTTLHEAGHALAAKLLGDRTAYYGGQVTLNPLPHIQREPMGMVAVPVLMWLLTGGLMGWASAPYDPFWAARYPRRAALMAAAGPLANLLLVVTAALCIRLGMYFDLLVIPGPRSLAAVQAADGVNPQLAQLLGIIFKLNLLLFLFNLLPLPPLDGSAIVQLFMRRETAIRYQVAMSQPQFAMVGLVAAWAVFAKIWPIVLGVALRLLYPEAT
jgi:Zn-dependent protease